MASSFAKCVFARDKASALLSMRARCMPWLRQSFATAKPMPEAAPVMRATLEEAKTGCGIATTFRERYYLGREDYQLDILVLAVVGAFVIYRLLNQNM